MKLPELEAIAGTQEAIAETKRLASLAQASLPEAMLKGIKLQTKRSYRRKPKKASQASYEGLQGEWLEWLEVATRYEVKVPLQDRADLRHTIILELALTKAKTTEPIPQYRAYRIASYMVADYYRQEKKLTTGLDCKDCSKAQRSECKEHDLYGECPKLIRLEYLDRERLDSEGNIVTLKDTLADDKAIDLDAWLDAKTFELGCPIRLIELAKKTLEGIPLSEADRRYYSRQKAKELKRYQKSLF